MAAIDLNALPDRALADGGGYLFGIDAAGGSVAGWRMPVTAVKTASDLAGTALQPADVAPMAYEDPAGWVPRSEYDVTVANLTSQNSYLAARIAQLESLMGIEGVPVYEAGIYEPGVYV
jgi:hypothetical protein